MSIEETYSILNLKECVNYQFFQKKTHQLLLQNTIL